MTQIPNLVEIDAEIAQRALDALPDPYLLEYQLDKALAERSLAEFTRQAWPIVEPGTAYVHNWHIDAICEHLELATTGEIRNLIINIPPRCMKSLLTCVMWPTWVWTWKPETRWMFASYAETLSIRDSVKCRNIIQSAWYQQRWGGVYQLAGDQNQKIRFDNNKMGFRMATSVDGRGTGEGGQYIVVDDPMKAGDADSELAREEVVDWWTQTMSTRGNDPKRMVRVIIMQRLHDRDLAGYLIEEMRDESATQYEVLCLPMEYEPNRCQLTTGFEEPRREPKELLWPERYDDPEVKRLHRELGESGFAAQMQQNPVPAGGGIFKSAWWEGERNRYEYGDGSLKASVVGRWIFIDSAFKDKESDDPSAASVLELLPDYRLLLRHVWEERINSNLLPERIETLATTWNYDGKVRGVVIEDKGSGTTALQTLRASAPAWLADLMVDFMPTGSKEYRARQAAIWCDRDCILFPYICNEASWLFDFVDPQYGQLFRFPAAKNDDMTDTFSMGIIFLENLIAAGWRARTGRGNE